MLIFKPLFLYIYDKIKYYSFLQLEANFFPFTFCTEIRHFNFPSLSLAWSPSSNTLHQKNEQVKYHLGFAKIIHNIGFRSLSSFRWFRKKTKKTKNKLVGNLFT